MGKQGKPASDVTQAIRGMLEKWTKEDFAGKTMGGVAEAIKKDWKKSKGKDFVTAEEGKLDSEIMRRRKILGLVKTRETKSTTQTWETIEEQIQQLQAKKTQLLAERVEALRKEADLIGYSISPKTA